MPHSPDSLHLLNDILAAVEHLKVDLKPEPKSHLEKYGYIYAACAGATIAIVGGVVTFMLNAWKEKKIRKEDNEKAELIRKEENAKEDKAIRHKIFSELKEVTGIFNDAVRQRDFALLNIHYQRAELALKFKDEESFIRDIDVNIKEIDYVSVNRNLKEKQKIYLDKLSNYIFHKEAKTEVLAVQTRILNIGMCYQLESFEGITDKKELDNFLEYQKSKMNNFWVEEISLPTTQILTYIMQNR